MGLDGSIGIVAIGYFQPKRAKRMAELCVRPIIKGHMVDASIA
jgi:hypothetical protein